jgi:hypothetical protein
MARLDLPRGASEAALLRALLKEALAAHRGDIEDTAHAELAVDPEVSVVRATLRNRRRRIREYQE